MRQRRGRCSRRQEASSVRLADPLVSAEEAGLAQLLCMERTTMEEVMTWVMQAN